MSATACGATDLFEQLPGLYQGQVAGAGSPLESHAVYHKIVEVAAPALGQRVLYHQISRDGFDSAEPMIQKFYVFDATAPLADELIVTPYAVPRGRIAANPETRPRELRRLSPAGLQSFPRDCALRWRRGADRDVWIAEPLSRRCRYQSLALGGTVVPELHYEWRPESFAARELLKDARGKPLFPDSGTIVARRVPANTAARVIALSRPAEWRIIDAERLLRMELASGAAIWLELAPALAPRAVDNILALVRGRYFDGLAINRVQDNFVVQWGDPTGTRPLGQAQRQVPAEFSRDWPAGLSVVTLPDPDGYAPVTGFLDGMPVAGDRAKGRLWGAHCYGALGVGRDDDENSGNGSELYVVIGHAPRQLDRNITLAGRVVLGIEHLSGLPRGPAPLGIYANTAEFHGIRSLRIAAELPPAEQPELQALRAESKSFAALIEARRNRRDDWYKSPAGHVDLCNLPLPVRLSP